MCVQPLLLLLLNPVSFEDTWFLVVYCHASRGGKCLEIIGIVSSSVCCAIIDQILCSQDLLKLIWNGVKREGFNKGSRELLSIGKGVCFLILFHFFNRRHIGLNV